MSGGRDADQQGRHLIGDVQRFGLLSAATVVERYIETVDRALAGHSLAPRSSDQPDEGWLVDGAARVAQAGTRVLDAIATAIADGGGHGVDTTDPERLVLPATQPGSGSEVSLWIHHPTPTPTPVTGLGLHVTALTSPTGTTIPTGAVSWTPLGVELLAASSRQEVRLRVDVPEGQPDGLYHGLVLSSLAPSEPLALRLEVRRQAGPHR